MPDARTLQQKDLLRLYRQMLFIRRFEEKAAEMYTLGKIGGFCHLYIGQEAVAVGALDPLRPEDYLLTTYRDHGYALALGTDPGRIMAELFGKAAGVSKGKGGSMHLFDADRNFLGGHAIVGGHIPIATGVGFAVKYRQERRVVFCSFGEGAVNAGAFHESLNLAALWRLPVIYLCENNFYEMGTPYEMTAAVKDLARRAEAYGVARATVDGTDVLAVRGAVSAAAQRAREESLPAFIEARTYRFVGHSMADPAHGLYRSKEDLEKQRGFDPIARFLPALREAKVEDSQLAAVEAEVQRAVEEAVVVAEASPMPSPETLYDDLYA